MSESISILDKEYIEWVRDLGVRYRQSQLQASVRVNRELLLYYWGLGKDIANRDAENIYGSQFYATLSADLRKEIPNVKGVSPATIRYAKRFYLLYCHVFENLQQAVEDSDEIERTQQLTEQIQRDVFSIPWGHHVILMDKCSTNPHKALFFIRQAVENGWSRAVLLNFLDTNLYERNGKAISNFQNRLPAIDSDLAQEITKDPYCFEFTGLRTSYNEKQLKDALIVNIEKFLIELGTGFAYMGREFRLEVGATEQFLDMLFYNVRLRCYVVVEVKTTEFSPSHLGQLGTYVVAVDHLLRKESDNKTIGLLICKTKDNVFAKYALEASSQPLGISEYELAKLYPTKVEGTIPSIEEIEKELH